MRRCSSATRHCCSITPRFIRPTPRSAGGRSGQSRRSIQTARDAGVADPERGAREYFGDPVLDAVGARYLRENIKYHLGERERAGLDAFYRYAAELGLVPESAGLRFYDAGMPERQVQARRLVRQES